MTNEEQVKKIIFDFISKKPGTLNLRDYVGIRPKFDLMDDLGLSELDLTDLEHEIETAFSIKIPDKTWIFTVNDLISVVKIGLGQ